MQTVSIDEWEARKAFVRFSPADVKLLESHHQAANSYVDEVVDAFYEHLRSFSETRALLKEQTVIGMLKRLQRDYYLAFTAGDYGASYLERRLRIGARHAEIGLSKALYVGSYSIYIQLVTPHVLRCTDPHTGEKTLNALIKLMLLDIGLALEAYG